MSTFAERLGERIKEYGPLCVGLDPSPSTLKACGLPDSAEGALAFGQRVLDATEGRVAIVKPQSAYFERFGRAGWETLEQTIIRARSLGIMMLLDAKRGDIDTTAEAYAQAFFRPESPCRVDALTVHPYLGFAALRRFLDFAAVQGGGVFVVVRSSNPEGEELQTARMANGRSVAEDLSESITAYNREQGTEAMGSVGAVVGATCKDADSVVSLMPHSYVLAPGVGAQGATIADLAKYMPHARRRVLPSVSRGILARGVAREEIATAIGELREQGLQLWS